MASPKAVGRFYVDTTRQAAKNTASAQDAAIRYMNELAGIGGTYFGIWSNAQQLSLQTAFQLQNSIVESVQGIWDTSAKANMSLFEEWAKTVAEGQTAMTRLTAAGVSMLASVPPSRAK